MCIFGAFSQIFGQQNTYLVGKYDFYVRCNNNTTKGMVASFEFPKTTQNEVTLNGIFIDSDNRPVNCSATFTYIDNSNIISVKTYMTKTYKPDFYRNDKFSIKMDDNDSGWVNMELGESYDAFCNLEGRIVKPNPSLTYGTTVITHGWQPPVGANPTSEGQWVNKMARAILQKANNKGCIRFYDKKTGNFEFLKDKCPNPNGDGENILMFNWANESNVNAKGYSEAAGDALFSSLLMGKNKKEFDLNNIHFIGHSRGTVVNTLTVERLLNLKNKYQEYSYVNIDQVSNLDAHDWGFNDRCSDIDDAHPDITVREHPVLTTKDNGTIAWKGVGFNDSYYQDDDVVLKGRRVKGADNYYWTSGTLSDDISHSGLHDVYQQTINGKSLIGGGYHFSRIGNNTSARGGRGNGEKDITFDFYNNMIIPNKGINRITGILNGSFDRFVLKNAPGWSSIGVSFTNGSARLSLEDIPDGSVGGGSVKFANSAILNHNIFYIPKDANHISFKLSAFNTKGANLTIKVKDVLMNTEKIIDVVKLENSLNNSFEEKYLDIRVYQDKIITLVFEFKSGILPSNIAPYIEIDEVKLIQGIPTNSSATTLNSTVEKLNIQNAQINKTQQATKIESTKIKENITKSGRVKTKEGSDLMLRAEPSIKASIIAEIPNRRTVNILEYSDKIVELNGEMGKWCKVDYDGKIGWVWEKFIETTISQEIVQPKSGYVKTKEGSDLRLRSAPSEKASIITKIANGSKVIILEKDDHFVTVNGDVGQWLKVKYEGTIGWAWGKFIIQN